MPHFDLTVESSTLDQLFGFLSAKGFAVDFDAREFDSLNSNNFRFSSQKKKVP